MAEVLLFHHVHGLTAGCLAFAEDLRKAGHTVHTPDLYEGKTFADLADGKAYVRELGLETFVDRGRAAAEELDVGIVYAGFSAGVLPAQLLAQTRPGAKGALLMHSAIPPAEFGEGWPAGLPGQIHTMDGDALGDLDVARELAADTPEVELFLYPGDKHLFSDSGLPDYDRAATDVLKQRVLAFLDAV
ncbi:dienelactone hydrolase family protein [Actinocrispum sp. NPDC049592]|uniref:dienelactone hydrolase family protein n=1 Tax=Actinocrispum sp. NPDC049592 TaxID=3154835 RepID=UPI0034405B95